MSSARVATFGILLMMATHACDCGDDVSPIDGGGNMSICEIRMMDAGPAPRCTSDDQCCDRESCNMSTGVCVPLDECEMDSDCTGEGQVCTDTDGDGFRECGFLPCMADTECVNISCPPEKIKNCAQERCICGTPCQGGCPASQGCCIPDDTCYDLPAECGGLTCPPGEMVVISSPGAWDMGTCAVVGESCACEPLPPLFIGDIGLHSALANDGLTAVLSAYNLTYGDLMFGVLQADGVTINWEFVDGVPPAATSSITGDVTGPRSGIGSVGDDVGLYTDLALDAQGRPHIAYHDRTHGALKYALLGTSGWQLHTVADDSGADGLYASITLDGNGRPVIAYLTDREDDGGGSGGRRSVLRLAVSASTEPSGPGDWTIHDLWLTTLQECRDRCRAGEVCRSSDQACVVPDPANNCSGCMQNQRCISGTCEAIDDLPPYMDVPRVLGAFPAVKMMGADIVTASQDRTIGELRVEISDAATGAQVQTLSVADGTDTTGAYPSLWVVGSEIHVAYMNETRRSLMYRTFDTNLTPGVTEEVETGLDQMLIPSGSYVGADPALVVDSLGVVRIAYQDATLGLVRYATRNGPDDWTITTLRGGETPFEGFFGFYVDQALDDARQNPLVSTYRYFLEAEGDQNGIEVLSAP